MSEPEARKVYANGVKDISLGLPHGRLPQVRPYQWDLNRNAVPENLRTQNMVRCSGLTRCASLQRLPIRNHVVVRRCPVPVLG